jgi:hypothetical protein
MTSDNFIFVLSGMISKPFGKNDPRLKITLEQHEPLVHFALVCGAKSCPPIKTYAAEVSYSGYPLQSLPIKTIVGVSLFCYGTVCYQILIPGCDFGSDQVLKVYGQCLSSSLGNVNHFLVKG